SGEPPDQRGVLRPPGSAPRPADRPVTPPARPRPAPPPEPLPPAALALGTELVARVDVASLALDAAATREKQLRDAARSLLRGAAGEFGGSAGPEPALAPRRERVGRAARRLARRAEDVTARFEELRAGLASLDREGEVRRAIEALRYCESLAAVHGQPGHDVSE